MAIVPVLGRDVAASKAKLFELLEYSNAAEPVIRFHASTARHLVVSAPARTSKSYSAGPELIHDGIPFVDSERGYKPAQEETHVWMVGVDYSTLKEFDYVWNWLSRDNWALIKFLGGTVTKAHNSPLAGNMQVCVEWGKAVNGRTARTVWTGKSATNEKSLQGEEVKTAVLSEAAEHDQRIVEKYLLTRCGRIIYPTTPKRKALWLWEMIQAGEADPSLGIEHIQFTHECNPTYDYERLEAARARSVATYGDWMEDDDFCEQLLGQWRFAEDRALPFRWLEDGRRPSNIARGHPDWFSCALYVVSTDYGYTDPAVALFWAIGPEGQLLIFEEVYQRLLSTPEFVAAIRAKEQLHGIRVKQYIADPQRPELSRVMRMAGLPVFASYDKRWVTNRAAGFKSLVDALSVDPLVGEPRLRVHERCERTIHEWKHLRRKSNSVDETAVEGRDDAADAARYGIQVIGRRMAPVTRESWVEKVTQAYRDASYRERLGRLGPATREMRV